MITITFHGFSGLHVEPSVRFTNAEQQQATEYFYKMKEFLVEYGYDSECVTISFNED